MSNKPVRPDDSECCGSGCRPCVFDVYEQRLKNWLLKQESFTESKALNQIKYLPFLIINIQNVGEFLKVFQFQSVKLLKKNFNLIQIENAELGVDFEILQEPLNLKVGEYVILKGIYEMETISRSYTPVLNKDSFVKGSFTIIVSLQPNGKMSSFLKKLGVNDIVFWRGPFQEFKLDYNSFKHVVLFGGGTGVVPLYNISKTITENEESETWVNVCACFKTTDSIILREEFKKLKDFWNFSMNIYITNQNQLNFRPQFRESVFFEKLSETVIKNEVEKCGEDHIFVIICGPEGFNHSVQNALKKFGISDENIFIFW